MIAWDGAPTIAVGAPAPGVIAENLVAAQMPTTTGGFLLGAPFTGGTVQDVAIAGVAGVPSALDLCGYYEICDGVGRQVSTGDLDGDGVSDLAIDGWFYRGPFTGVSTPEAAFAYEFPVGRTCDVTPDGISDWCTGVVVYFGPFDGTSDDDEHDVWFEDQQLGAAGDWDEDGVADAACYGAEGLQNAVYWFAELRAGTLTEADATVRWLGTDLGFQPTSRSTRMDADVTGDGARDLVVGAGVGEGRVWILADRVGGDLDTEAYTVIDGAPRSALGTSVEAGDFDGDGQSDLALGGDGYVLVFRGPVRPGALTDADADLVLWGPVPRDGFGYALAAGDLDGDGAEDLVVGAPYTPNEDAIDQANGDPSKGGAVYVYWSGGL